MFTFLNPAWLTAIPIVFGTLLFLYLRHGKHNLRKVSSLFFIRQLKPSEQTSRRKLSLPLRMLFELLILMAVIFALAGALKKDSSAGLRIVIDNSLSMSARFDPARADSISVLDKAKELALSNLDYFSDTPSLSVWISSPVLKEISSVSEDSAAAKEKIRQVQISYSADDLAAALAALPESAGRTLVFSDAQVSAKSSADSAIQLVNLNPERRFRENIALSSISLEKALDQAGDIVVTVQAFINSRLTCSFTLSVFSAQDAKWTKAASTNLSLSEKGIDTLRFSLAELASGGLSDPELQIYKAQIADCSREDGNALKADDSLWLNPVAAQGDMLLVSSFSAQQLKLNNLSAFKFKVMSPEQWEQSAEIQESAKFVIFHRYLPKQIPSASSLFVYPQNSNSWLKSNQIGQKSRIIDWNKQSPLLKYLNFPDLQLEHSTVFSEIPAWSRSFLKSTFGDIALSGRLNACRLAALGFELFPFDGKANLPISILTLNLLNWISNEEQLADSTQTISIKSRVNIDSADLKDSALPETSLTVSQDKKSLELTSPGLVRINSGQSGSYAAVGKFIESESNLLLPAELNFTAKKTNSEAVKESGQKLEYWLIVFALVILAIDTLLSLRKKDRVV